MKKSHFTESKIISILKEQELLKIKENIEMRLLNDRGQYESLPDEESVKEKADLIRRQFLEKYSGEKRLQNMTFEEKRLLLHWLFDGKDKKGTEYGIYITKKGRGKAQQIDYFMYGRITGMRTLKGDDIDYYEEEGKYKTSTVTRNHKDR